MHRTVVGLVLALSMGCGARTALVEPTLDGGEGDDAEPGDASVCAELARCCSTLSTTSPIWNQCNVVAYGWGHGGVTDPATCELVLSMYWEGGVGCP